VWNEAKAAREGKESTERASAREAHQDGSHRPKALTGIMRPGTRVSLDIPKGMFLNTLMSPLQIDRQPGDPIPPDIIKEFRTVNRLTQEQLANRLGVRGGKPVISGWETGRTVCEGPAAEFLLHLMGRANVAFSAAGLRVAMNAEWERTGQPTGRWRQLSCVPESAIEIEPQNFVKLFPDAAIDNGSHGFPFAKGMLQSCTGIRPDGWVGSIPTARTDQPTYLWMLRRDLSFADRARAWEDDPGSVTAGNVDVGYELLHALETALFIRGLATHEPPMPEDIRFTFYLDLAGVHGRGLVDATQPRGPHEYVRTWAEDEAHASISVSASEIYRTPIDVAIQLVSALAAQLGDEFTSDVSLRLVLKNRKRDLHFVQILHATGARL
jgi:transcriptional regulator with XRE-family HTH domain